MVWYEGAPVAVGGWIWYGMAEVCPVAVSSSPIWYVMMVWQHQPTGTQHVQAASKEDNITLQQSADCV